MYFGIVGGVLIGLSTVGLMFTLGRTGGLSGIVQASIWSDNKTWRILFLIGLITSTSVFQLIHPDYIKVRQGFPLGLLSLSGVLVGLGAILGNGCTSGHGICGISRFSKRSIVATIVFFSMALLTRFLVHNVWELTP